MGVPWYGPLAVGSGLDHVDEWARDVVGVAGVVQAIVARGPLGAIPPRRPAVSSPGLRPEGSGSGGSAKPDGGERA